MANKASLQESKNKEKIYQSKHLDGAVWMRWSLDPALSWKQHNDEHYSWFTANSTDPEVQREFWLLRSHNSCAGTCGQQQFVPIPGSYSIKSVNTLNSQCTTQRGAAHTLGTELCPHRALPIPAVEPRGFPSWISILKGKDICLESTQKQFILFFLFVWVQVFPLARAPLARATSASLETLTSQIKCLEMMPQYFSWEWHKNLAEKCSL